MSMEEEKLDSAEETRLPAPASLNRPRREHNDTPRASDVGSSSVKVLSCRVDGCPVSLSSFRRKHRVCEIHCKAPSVIVQGLAQRFCQTCSRFHVASEFDGKKRSCRRTLAERNEKRRKSLHDFDSRNASKALLYCLILQRQIPVQIVVLCLILQSRDVMRTSIFLPRTLNQKKNPNARHLQYQA